MARYRCNWAPWREEMTLNWYPAGFLHVLAASCALATGLAVFVSRKGTARHRWLGRVYLALMLVVNGSALTIFRDAGGGFGVFHYLALVSLATLTAAYGSFLLRRRARNWQPFHAHMMAWSYVGLAAAAAGQAGTHYFGNAWAPIVGVLVVGGLLISRRVPAALVAGPGASQSAR